MKKNMRRKVRRAGSLQPVSLFHRPERHRGAHGEVKRGARIIDLKEEQPEFLAVLRLTDLVRKFSEVIGFPIEFHVEKSKEEEVSDSVKNEDKRGGR